MNILFITKTDGHVWSGPSYSVPRGIKAQTEEDNVFWYNLYDKETTEFETLKNWRKEPYYHDLLNYPEGKISKLPKPFCKPDIIIVEELYNFGFNPILFELMRGKIPYIIVPRSVLTRQGQKRHWYKKIPANLLLFNRFIRNALAIQYLTRQEAQESGTKWNNNKFIIPNGCDMPLNRKLSYSNNGIKGVYIGRIEMYQKGLDMLIKAIYNNQSELRDAHFTMHIYGYNKNQSVAKLREAINNMALGDIIEINERTVVGEEKERILLESDVFIMPSRFEGHPMALIEALSYGLPCLVTTGTNMKEEIEDANAGWGAESNESSITSALKRLIGDINSISSKGENARLLASSYSWKEIAKVTHDTITKLLNE